MPLQELNIKNYAHIGDAVYEVFIREHTIMMTSNLSRLHKLTVHYVNAAFQTELLNKLFSYFTEKEADISRRARNIAVSSARRVDRTLHSYATSLEAVLGYNYVHDKNRYNELCSVMTELIDFDNCKIS